MNTRGGTLRKTQNEGWVTNSKDQVLLHRRGSCHSEMGQGGRWLANTNSLTTVHFYKGSVS